jgi:hypothetical protein
MNDGGTALAEAIPAAMDDREHPTTTIDASKRFAEAAREAQRKGQHGRAAALFRAALLLLKGEPVDEYVSDGVAGEVVWVRAVLSRSRQAATRLLELKYLNDLEKRGR